MKIGERIKHRRIELGLSVDEVAKKLNKNRATIYRYENNQIENFPITLLEPLAEILQTTPAYLIGCEERPQKKQELILERTYIRLAKEAEALDLDEDDINLILKIFKKHKEGRELVIQKYLAFTEENLQIGKTAVIVQAENEEEALKKFYKHLANMEQDYLRNYVKDIHCGFVQEFLNGDEVVNNDAFKERIYEFFKGTNYAEKFINIYSNADKELDLPDTIIDYIIGQIAPDFFPECIIKRLDQFPVI